MNIIKLMANVQENENNELNNQPPANPPGILNRIPLLVPQNMEDPRSRGFVSTFRSIFCPTLNVVSFVFVVSLIDILLYLVSLFHSASTGGLESKDDIFLAPSNSTLILFGAKVFLRQLLVPLLHDNESRRRIPLDYADLSAQ